MWLCDREDSGRCDNVVCDRARIDLNEEATIGPLSLCYNMDVGKIEEVFVIGFGGMYEHILAYTDYSFRFGSFSGNHCYSAG